MSGEAGIPPAARERLARLRATGGPAFSSALGSGETLAIRQAGFRPITQVVGISYYKVGWQQMPWGTNRGYGGWGSGTGEGETFELDSQTEAWNEARRLAIGRLREEAAVAGADAVLGVHIRRSTRDWSSDLVEFVAVGTAVRSERYDLGAEGPLLCNLSGQDVAKLVTHGFWPVGIVGGSTVAYVATGSRQQFRAGGLLSRMQNQELPDFTQGLYDARALAMERVTRDAHALHAHGVVGVLIDRSQRERDREINNTTYTDLIITMHVLGTAIVEVEGGPEPPPKFIALPLT
ncbi:MAG: heavy metal-binding protein [Conexibacter sp.]|nr:heavy metal-binding protein [Conexibacter sp.]